MSRLAWPAPRSSGVLARLLRAAWTLPTNVLGHTVGLALAVRAPKRVGGRAARAWTYAIRPSWAWLGAVTFGDVIVHVPGVFDGPAGRILLAHELAHVRQHTWLGPLYLPAHAVAQIWSAIRTPSGGPPGSRVHARNPLEQTWLCLGFDAARELADGKRLDPDERERYLAAFDV